MALIPCSAYFWIVILEEQNQPIYCLEKQSDNYTLRHYDYEIY